MKIVQKNIWITVYKSILYIFIQFGEILPLLGEYTGINSFLTQYTELWFGKHFNYINNDGSKYCLTIPYWND